MSKDKKNIEEKMQYNLKKKEIVNIKDKFKGDFKREDKLKVNKLKYKKKIKEKND